MRDDRPSSTALLIARSTLLATYHPALKSLVLSGAAEPLRAMLDAAGRRSWLDFALRQAWSRRLLWLGERAILPGIVAHYLSRKRWIEQRVTDALTAGCRQVVILGAGCDTL